jgi:transposase
VARESGCDFAARHQLRVEHAPKLLGTIQEKLEAAQQQALPASKLGKAVAYVLGLWPRLENFLQHPEVELSNNLAENSMRGVALGRKNWIHIGSPTAGPRVAAILTVTESCRRLGIPIREYLAAILPGLADVRIQKLADLTPAAWAARLVETGRLGARHATILLRCCLIWPTFQFRAFITHARRPGRTPLLNGTGFRQ